LCGTRDERVTDPRGFGIHGFKYLWNEAGFVSVCQPKGGFQRSRSVEDSPAAPRRSVCGTGDRAAALKDKPVRWQIELG
jgi:hypothetical protein